MTEEKKPSFQEMQVATVEASKAMASILDAHGFIMRHPELSKLAKMARFVRAQEERQSVHEAVKFALSNPALVLPAAQRIFESMKGVTWIVQFKTDDDDPTVYEDENILASYTRVTDLVTAQEAEDLERVAPASTRDDFGELPEPFPGVLRFAGGYETIAELEELSGGTETEEPEEELEAGPRSSNPGPYISGFRSCDVDESGGWEAIDNTGEAPFIEQPVGPVNVDANGSPVNEEEEELVSIEKRRLVTDVIRTWCNTYGERKMSLHILSERVRNSYGIERGELETLLDEIEDMGALTRLKSDAGFVFVQLRKSPT